MKKEYFEKKVPFFIWELEFSEVFEGEDPGFDIVIGHPPFGRDLQFGKKFSDEEYNFLKGKYIKQEGKPQKVIYFIELAYDKLLKNNGELGFIVPKPFNYVSQYIPIRHHILDNIKAVIDCGEAWENVKGEQIILIVNKSQKFDSYYNGAMVIESSEIYLEELDKDDVDDFDIILNCVNNEEIELAKKIKKSNRFLESITENKKGPNFQSNECPDEKYEFIGGNEIQREGIVAIQGKIQENYIKNPSSHIKDNSILVQDILSLGKNEALKVTACVTNTNDLYICNTIDQIIIEKFTKFNKYFFWALFNSRLINWYCHKFIYANAVRDMHFNKAATNKIPLPAFDAELIDDITIRSIELNNKNQKLLSLKESMFDCLRNNIYLKEEIKNFEELDFNEFIRVLKSEQKITIKKEKKKNLKKFFNKIKNECLNINEKINSLEAESIESKDFLYQELYLLKEPMFDYLKDKLMQKIKTTTDGKIKNFENLDYNEFIDELSKQNIKTESINNFEEFFNDKKDSCSEINEEIMKLEEELNSKIYDLYQLKNERKIIDDYFSSERVN